MEALDEEMGVGFDRHSTRPPTSPPYPPASISAGYPGRSHRARRDLVDLLLRARDWGATAPELDADTIGRLATESRRRCRRRAGRHGDAARRGASRSRTMYGPSGVTALSAGSADGDAELADAVREHLRAEEAHAPGVVFAELVHLEGESAIFWRGRSCGTMNWFCWAARGAPAVRSRWTNSPFAWRASGWSCASDRLGARSGRG